jgi:hypothetical protein
LESEYPELTPYQVAGNQVIQFIELEGLETAEPKTQGTNDEGKAAPQQKTPKPTVIKNPPGSFKRRQIKRIVSPAGLVKEAVKEIFKRVWDEAKRREQEHKDEVEIPLENLKKKVEKLKEKMDASKNKQKEVEKQVEKSKTLVYRSMKMDANGLPVLEESAQGLGVRPDLGTGKGDIPLSDDFFVAPETGGMSVAPFSPTFLPAFRRPPGIPNSFGVFDGSGKAPVWQFDLKQLPPGLKFDQDSPTHGTFQPAYHMQYDEYKAKLESTQKNWKLIGGLTKG